MGLEGEESAQSEHCLPGGRRGHGSVGSGEGRGVTW